MPNKGTAFGRAERVICPHCGREVAIARTSGRLRPHNDMIPRRGKIIEVTGHCPGSGTVPR
jgi:C4-type Zn-finger protein